MQFFSGCPGGDGGHRWVPLVGAGPPPQRPELVHKAPVSAAVLLPRLLNPRIEEFLAFEKEWLTGERTLAKVLARSLVAVILAALAPAFWGRCFWWGIAIINAIALGKVSCGVASGGDTGWTTLLPPSWAQSSATRRLLRHTQDASPPAG